MSIFSGKFGLVVLLAALCLGGRTANAQAGPMAYWTPGWPVGFDDTVGQGSNTYGNFPSFGSGGFSYQRYNFSNGWFVGSERGGMGLNGFGQRAGFGGFGSLYSEGVQFGYSDKIAGGLPITVFAGFDTLKYNTGIGSSLGAFDSTAGTLPGYSAHAGVEFRPASNVSVTFGASFTQLSGGRVDSDINSSLLPGASPFAFGARR